MKTDMTRKRPPCGTPVIAIGLLALSFGPAGHADAADVWQAGFARVVITPEEPMWASGYGSRTHPSAGKIHDLYARLAVLQDPAGHTVVFVSTDLIGVTRLMSDVVTQAAHERFGSSRADVLVSCSHTHCGPALDDNLSYMLKMTDADWEQVRAYQKSLNQKLVSLVTAAANEMQPARISFGNGHVGFASNRRQPVGEGPNDHEVPVMKITSFDGSTIRGIIFGYACHNTTLALDQWCGDYAGFAQLDLEGRYSTAVALFFTGCGADQNPLPRRTLELAEKYGRMLSQSVVDVLEADTTAIEGRLATRFREIELPFESVPDRATVEDRIANGSHFEQARARNQLKQIERDGHVGATYRYPVQVWQVGSNLTWVSLGGEVVVDYSLRLKRELGPGRTWVTGYAHDVMCYIPSERVLNEGGYEGATSMVYYQMPSRWKAGTVEEPIIGTVHELAKPPVSD